MQKNTTTYNIKKPITLLGMMGVGKTTYGKKLAAKLGVDFFDVDHVIEDEIGHSVSWIFENAGEDKFRDMEQRVIKELLEDKSPKVVALGGGAFNNKKGREFIKEKSRTIWLTSSAETIYSRVKVRKDRPLLEDVDDKLQKIKDIVSERETIYSEADFTVVTDEGTHKEIIETLVEIAIKKLKTN